MGKRDRATAVSTREILVDAISGAIASHRGDWLSVAEDLAARLAVQYLKNQDDVDGMLDQIVALAKRAERAECRLEHYRRKEVRARTGQIWESCRPRSAISILNEAVWLRKNNDGLSDPDDPSDIKRCKNLLRCAAESRLREHAEGKGVP